MARIVTGEVRCEATYEQKLHILDTLYRLWGAERGIVVRRVEKQDGEAK